MTFLKPYIPYIIEGVVLLLVYYIYHELTTKKSNLVYYMTSGAFFNYTGRPPLALGTHTTTIKNFGRAKAEDIKICHGKVPKIVVYPDVEYTIDRTPQGSDILKFAELAPKSSIVISYMYKVIPDVAKYMIKYVRSADGEARNILTIVNPIYPKKYQVIAVILMLLGTGFLIVLLYEFIKFILALIKLI